jgi:hypothetical protein
MEKEMKVEEKEMNWRVKITEQSVTFTEREKEIIVPRSEARARLSFSRGKVTVDKEETFHDAALRETLETWFPKRTLEELKGELRKWGIGLLILGGIQIALSSMLDPVWGILMVGLGIVNLLVHRRAMLVVNGIAIMVAGGFNLFAGQPWTAFGIMQFIWGIKEMKKCGEFEEYSLHASAVIGYNQAK